MRNRKARFIFTLTFILLVNRFSFGKGNESSTLDSSGNTTILYVFSGSDWCASCIRFKKKILTDTAFLQSMAKAKITIEIVDFPQRTKLAPDLAERNRAIAEKFNFEGVFPTFVIYLKTQKQFKTFYYYNEDRELFCSQILNLKKEMDEGVPQK